MRYLSIILIAIVFIAAAGCEKSSENPINAIIPEGADLLGLQRDHQLRYVIYDTLVSYYPYSVRVETTYVNVDISQTANGQVQLSEDGVARDLLTVDDIGVLHSGQIRANAFPPDTLFFIPTPIVMPKSFAINEIHHVQSPRLMTNLGGIRSTFLYFNYGFYTQRTFGGQKQIVVPFSSFNTYYFQSVLFLNESSTDTIMTVDEYYADDIGLVMLSSSVAGTHRLIVLLEDN